MKILERFTKRSQLFWIVFGFALIGVVGVLDFLTGNEITLSLFYLVPIAMVTWFVSRPIGIVASFVSAFVWLLVQISNGISYSNPFLHVWNTFIQLSFFVIVVFLL